MIIFCGEVIIGNNKTTFEYHEINPPIPVKSFVYKCNSKFEIETAIDLTKQHDIYGLVVLDLHEACWGSMSGTNINVLGSFDSIVPSKHSQGGQSSVRFERLRDIAIHEFFIKLGERLNASFLPLDKDIKGILIGGCGMTKNEFTKGNFLHHELKKKIIDTFDTGYTNEYGLHELIEASRNKLTDIQAITEKEDMDEFLKILVKDISKCTYGYDDVISKTNMGQTKKILISSGCDHQVIEQMLSLSDKWNCDVKIISDQSESGKILKDAFGGIVSILRYSSPK